MYLPYEVYISSLFKFKGIGTMAYGPLACGVLTGKYDDGIPLHTRASLKVSKTSIQHSELRIKYYMMNHYYYDYRATDGSKRKY